MRVKFTNSPLNMTTPYQPSDNPELPITAQLASNIKESCSHDLENTIPQAKNILSAKQHLPARESFNSIAVSVKTHHRGRKTVEGLALSGTD